jgi:hypothetical protein
MPAEAIPAPEWTERGVGYASIGLIKPQAVW